MNPLKTLYTGLMVTALSSGCSDWGFKTQYEFNVPEAKGLDVYIAHNNADSRKNMTIGEMDESKREFHREKDVLYVEDHDGDNRFENMKLRCAPGSPLEELANPASIKLIFEAAERRAKK
ncbi:TPA: hypothetical protein HA265_05970 [Candidatus Woesearchaeota archaeon]|nr:hypothetical protein [Candidatus Woesearchaeota archaeon]